MLAVVPVGLRRVGEGELLVGDAPALTADERRTWNGPLGAWA
jgi:hypothetical protein